MPNYPPLELTLQKSYSLTKVTTIVSGVKKPTRLEREPKDLRVRLVELACLAYSGSGLLFSIFSYNLSMYPDIPDPFFT